MNNFYHWTEESPEMLEKYATGCARAFYANYDLPGAHYALWLMMKTLFINDKNNLDISDRERIIEFYEELHQLITALSFLYKT